MTINFEELYKPYAEKATLEETFAWLRKECSGRAIPEGIMQQAINETFLEMNDGLDFPTDGANTGFDNIPHACMNIYMLGKAVYINKFAMEAIRRATEGRLNELIDSHIKLKKSKFKKSRKLLNFKKSSIVRGLIEE